MMIMIRVGHVLHGAARTHVERRGRPYAEALLRRTRITGSASCAHVDRYTCRSIRSRGDRSISLVLRGEKGRRCEVAAARPRARPVYSPATRTVERLHTFRTHL